MVFVSRKYPTSSRHLDPGPERFSDNLVGHVLPRAPGARNHADLVENIYPPEKAMPSDAPSIAGKHAPLSLAGPSPNKRTTSTPPTLSGLEPTAQTRSAETDKKSTRKRRDISRREQCRQNQARYRSRQRNLKLQLEGTVKRLRQEVDHLKQAHEGLLSGEPVKHSPWTIVVGVFRLVEDSVHSPWRMTNATGVLNDAQMQRNLTFLRECVLPGVAMGNLSGVESLTNQLRRFALNLGDPKLHLQRIEAMAPSVMISTARLYTTVTELTLSNAFPKLSKGTHQDAGDTHAARREQLLGQRLNCSCTTTLFFDEKTGRVERLEVSTDLVGPLLRVFGNLGDVASATISSCIMG
ncbi:hypothetical protein PHYPSEUDO_004091 [Phytophthora pseudosyringae]|uniref:BZIP domain-containing protein n=1 Tax=Phytophthora pseudosyringae TaxID=221518 RepID=A0A8T1WIS0_9STRA|nr:hypothetical protein PHYPSEUDO_004091 [Phytophthora pseudosyringae]